MLQKQLLRQSAHDIEKNTPSSIIREIEVAPEEKVPLKVSPHSKSDQSCLPLEARVHACMSVPHDA